MSRSDLLLKLAEAGAQGNHPLLEQTVAALAAEARAKQHHLFADRLLGVLETNRAAPAADATGTYVPDKVRDLVLERPARRTLEELFLPRDAVTSVSEFIEEQQRADVLRAHSIEPRHRVMLVGPPGNGKTTLAEAIAYALAVPFFVVRYDSIIGSYLGETATRLKRVFDFARSTPCVLFLDEFDAVGKERGDIHETGEIKRVVSSLLLQIDELPSYTVVVCATNHPELLDRAVWRRFQLRLELPMPDGHQLDTILRSFFGRLGAVGRSLPYSEMINVLAGASFAEIEQFVLDIQRKIVLSKKDKGIKAIVGDVVQRWHHRYQAEPAEDVVKDGSGTSNSPHSTGRAG
jgi:hypothetical protein